MPIINVDQLLYALINKTTLVELRVKNIKCKNEELSFISTEFVSEPNEDMQRNNYLTLKAITELNLVNNVFRNPNVFIDKGDALKRALSAADEHVDDLIDDLLEGRQERTDLRNALAEYEETSRPKGIQRLR